MVKKLFKHEILSYIRIWVPLNIILLGVALLGRIIQLFEADTKVYDIVFGSEIFVYAVAIIAAIGITLALGIIRFYKNLFTGEGYLSFTLPVTPSQHICVKAAVATLFQLLTFVAVMVSAAIMTAGDVLYEVIRAVNYLIKLFSDILGIHLPLYIAEAVLLCISVLFVQFLFYYTCISIGQLFHKNRVLAAVGVYFGFYVITQIIGTVFLILFTSFSYIIDFEKLGEFVSRHKFGVVHGSVGILEIIVLILGAVYFFVSKRIITRKLNLE